MKNKSTRIAIIGAGAAGLSSAYFLKKQGFNNVVIFEKDDRVGGRCLSETVDGKSFDLGANYVTSNYKMVKELAKELKADLYAEDNVKSYNLSTGEFRSVFSALLQQSSIFTILWKSLVYIWKRWRLNKVISPESPGYKHIADHPELCQSFAAWLKENKLSQLTLIFEIPITLMGYGELNEIPAAYALTYIPVSVYLDLAFGAISTKILGYPKRFTDGYQRFLERLSWVFDTDSLKLNTKVLSVKRGKTIKITYVDLTAEPEVEQVQEFDFLFVCTPLYLKSLKTFITDLSTDEEEVFGQVEFNPFVITTYKMPGCEPFSAGTFIIPGKGNSPEVGKPYVVNRQYRDTDYITMYTRSKVGEKVDRDKILAANATFIKNTLGLDLCEPFTYNNFVYFPHVNTTAMANGFYERLENMQGEQSTFFVGGLMNFELVETIMNYSKKLVEDNFPKSE